MGFLPIDAYNSIALRTVSGDVFSPPTTSTRGMTWGGVNGCPMTQRSGRLHADCITLIVMPEELDAIIESGGVVASISANNLILKSGRSGPFSCTRSASETAFFISTVKLSLSREAVFASPSALTAGHAVSTYLRRAASAFGAGSVAITSNPRAKNCAAQLAPMTPVPTMAIRLMGLSDVIFSLLLARKCALTCGRLHSEFDSSLRHCRSYVAFLAA